MFIDDLLFISTFSQFLASQFQPIIPKEVTVSPRDFCTILPYHIMINTESKILHAGLMIQVRLHLYYMGNKYDRFGDSIKMAKIASCK